MRRGMVWMVEKKIVHHILDMGFELVEIPVRVKSTPGSRQIFSHKTTVSGPLRKSKKF